MANASKNKGKSWERDVAEHLSNIYGVNFQRVPNSGAYLGGFNAFRTGKLTPEQLLLASGDIIMPAFLSHITIECKFYKDFTFETLLTKNGQLEGWLEQACQSSKIPFVLFKINRHGGYVVFPYDIKDKLHIQQNHLVYAVEDKESKAHGLYMVVKMEDFFERNQVALVALDENNYKMWLQRDIQSSTNRSLQNGVPAISN
jgi:Holliday junction resolvase